MNVLFLSTRSPLPTIDGNSLRTFNLLKQASSEHEVIFLSFVKHPEEHDHAGELAAVCNSVTLFDIEENTSAISLGLSLFCNIFSNKPFVQKKYDKKAMREKIRSVLLNQQIDIVHLESLPLACYLEALEGHHVILSTQNVESSLLQRRVNVETNPVARLFYGIQQRRLARFERDAVSRAGAVLVCSDIDKSALQQMVPGCSPDVVPNGVDIDFFAPMEGTSSDRNKIVFVGGMNWFPNRDAVEWFDREIMPLLLMQNPSTTVHVIGKSDPSMTMQNTKNFVIHGFVDDIRPHVADAAVFICPIRVGGGTRLKLLDAMAMGKAIVSTNIGAEGLGVKNHEQMVLADTPDDFAKAILALQEDPDERGRLGQAARAFVVENYSWSGIGRTLHEVYEREANRRIAVKG